MDQQQPQPFEQSPEAQEYIDKLQQGRVQLPPEATKLEGRAFENLQKLGRQRREMTTTQGDIEKQIDTLQGRQTAILRDIDTTNGQMAAYANLLVAAEGDRRLAVDDDASSVPDTPEPPTGDDSASPVAAPPPVEPAKLAAVPPPTEPPAGDSEATETPKLTVISEPVEPAAPSSPESTDSPVVD